MTAYQGFDVLEVQPDWPDARTVGFSRKEVRLDNSMAAISLRDRGAGNFGSISFRWTCLSRQEAQVLRDFIDARKGRLVPFWMPTWIQDFTLSQAAASTDQGIVVRWRGYTDKAFPDTSRRDLAIYTSSGVVYRRITSASATASAETLALNAALGAAVPVGSLVCHLLLCRLDTDEPEITWESDAIATCDLSVVEIPKEVP